MGRGVFWRSDYRNGAKMTAIPRRSRLLDDVVARLRDDIVTGRLAPGSKLLQADLAERLQVSRTPLREAFRILALDGLVSISDSNRSVEVVSITTDDLSEMYEVREVVDGLAARLAAQRGMSEEGQRHARSLLREMERTIGGPFDPSARVSAHAEFHELIARESGNFKLADFFPLIRSSSAALSMPQVDEPAAVTLQLDGEQTTFEAILRVSQQQHEAILAAIVTQDAAAAEAAARSHIQRTLHLTGMIDEWRKAIAAFDAHSGDPVTGTLQ